MKKNIRKLHESFLNAFRGLGLCIHGERNFRVHMVTAFYVTIFALLGEATAAEASILCVCFGLTMGAELMNTAIERLCDRQASGYDGCARCQGYRSGGRVRLRGGVCGGRRMHFYRGGRAGRCPAVHFRALMGRYGVARVRARCAVVYFSVWENAMNKITKTAVVSVVGRPNVGKSTLTNKLVGQKVAIVSSKPQTTRTRITGILNRDGTQYVFLDTPGLHRPRSRLGDYMCKVVTDTVSEVDAAVLVVEPIANIGPAEESLIAQLKQHRMPAILAINKIDTLKKEELLAVIAVYAQAHDFEAVVPISARTGEGLDELLTEIGRYAIEGPQLFPEDMVSDQPERQLAAEIVREKMLRLLDREVPHGVAVGVERWNEREDGLIEINAVIYCEKASHKGIIIGKQGAMLKEIGRQARVDIERMLDAKVFLELWVKVKEGWRNNQYQMRNFGYEEL